MTGTENIFSQSDLTIEMASNIVADNLHKSDDGELFVEMRQSEAVSLDDGRIKNVSFDISKGFGFRSVIGDMIGYAHSSDISKKSLLSIAQAATLTQRGLSGTMDMSPKKAVASYYDAVNPLEQQSLEEKIQFLRTAEDYIRARDAKISQVSLSLVASYQNIIIIRADNSVYYDNRPLVRMSMSVIMKNGNRQEIGSYGCGGRTLYNDFLQEDAWKAAADEAIRQALVNLESVPCPAGEMEVVLGAGWPGVLLHEAVGHGLEGDFNRKKTSAFSELMGKQVAAKGVNVVDDGTIHQKRGSLTIDDEGTPTQRNVLIEDGILTGYMQDRLNGRLMGTGSTGNGRRESYQHAPMPRMTNTFMLGADYQQEEIISTVKNGIYAANFGGGQVDITSGKFVFDCTEAYKIENGKITVPLKGATLIGSGPESLKYITMIGNDMRLDSGIGTCGKSGQGVPCGVGQPSMKLSKMLVGGTQTN